MAEKAHFFDVWVIETNSVYRKVPFTVVSNWVQQGRLLEEDRLRATGTEKWVTLSQVPVFAAYLPKVEPFRAEDQAEALEPVQVDFGWRARREDEDQDVDMIPLIDISLVLLIFFMMTAAVGSAAAIATPEAEHKLITPVADSLWVGMDADGTYSLGQGEKAGTPYATRAELLRALSERLQEESGPVDVRVRAHKDLPLEAVRDMIAELEKFKAKRQIHSILGEVSEKKPS
jgi:biopolymer transport protein ExbD